MSIRLKITLWFSAVLLVIVGVTLITIFSISQSVIHQSIQSNLMGIIEDNYDEVEYYSLSEYLKIDKSKDLYLPYQDGYLEIDDDFLDFVNGISSAVYDESGTLLYGDELKTQPPSVYPLKNEVISKVPINGSTYYFYDKSLDGEGLEGLWLRGIVSEQQGAAQLSSIVQISLYILPIFLIFAICGGYFIAHRALQPIRKIEHAATQIGNGADLKQRIHLPQGKDELHSLANTFNAMFERLDSAFASERQFTSDVSHELRTPVSVIMAQCEYTLEQARNSAEYESALKTIQRQSQKMNRLIDTMLHFIRIEQNAGQFSKSNLDLSALVLQICTDMAILNERGIIMSHAIAKNITILGNADLLSRLLINLITNAYRYGRENGTIHVALTSNQSIITLSVTDNGIGIAPENLENVFRRFFQEDSSRSSAGAGLGLAMAREIAHFHHGTLRVESVLHQGSVFILTLSQNTY